MKTNKQILLDAADLIDERGHSIGFYVDPIPADPAKPCYCMAGAIMHCAGAEDCDLCISFPAPGQELVRQIAVLEFEDTPEFPSNLFDFNDSNSAPDVADKLRKIAEAF